MLVLSRKKDERIVIGNGITITVVEIRGGRVRLGIDAPANVKVMRAEIVEKDANESRTRQTIALNDWTAKRKARAA